VPGEKGGAAKFAREGNSSLAFLERMLESPTKKKKGGSAPRSARLKNQFCLPDIGITEKPLTVRKRKKEGGRKE